jgi:hypothetical protein
MQIDKKTRPLRTIDVGRILSKFPSINLSSADTSKMQLDHGICVRWSEPNRRCKVLDGSFGMP